MKSISRFLKFHKKGICKITGRGEATCPVCGKMMKSHGRCIRYVCFPGHGRVKFSLRVFFCPACHRYHRELPDFIIPYKHHCVKTFADIYDLPLCGLCCNVDEKAIRLMRKWVDAFLKYGQEIVRSIMVSCSDLVESKDFSSTKAKIKSYIKLELRTGEWKFMSSPLETT